jgi:hypothetical protein
VLKDFFSEVLNPGDTMSVYGDCAPTPQISERSLLEWQDKIRHIFISVDLHQRKNQRFLLASGIMAPAPGMSEVHVYDTDTSDPDAEGEDDNNEDEVDQLEMETARHMEERPGSDSGSDSESD